MATARAIILVLLLLPASAALALAEERTTRIMLVHGVWLSGPWEREFRESLSRELEEIDGHTFELTEQFLGLYSYSQRAPIERFSRHIEALVSERNIDFVVCILPAACELVAGLNLGSAHAVMVGARTSTIADVRGRTNTTAIRSASRSAIRTTIEQIDKLRPGTDVHFFSGSSVSDQNYLRVAEEAAAASEVEAKFHFHVADSPTSLIEWAEQLDPRRDTAFVLTTESYGSPPTSFVSGSLDRLVAASQSPVFIFWDAAIGNGVVGGHVVSAMAYSQQVSALVGQWVRGQPLENMVSGKAVSIYDARQVKRWDLALDRLEPPVMIRFEQPGIWDTNPVLAAAATAIGVLLLAIVIMLIVFLRQGRTARRRLIESEREARESAALYRLVAEDSADFVWTYDVASAAFIYCSPAIESISGFTVEEFRVSPIQQMVSADSYDRLVDTITREPERAVVEVDHIRKDGGLVPCEVAIQILRSPETGEAQTLVGVSRDIRERRRREQAQERRQERHKMESLGRLAAGIAHDFNNVLGVIVGLSEMLDADRTESRHEYALKQRLIDAAERGRRLVSRIMTFARTSSDNREALNLRSIIDATAAYVEAVQPESVTLKIQARTDVRVLGDGRQLEQVVVNLMTNAIEAVSADGGVVSVSLGTARVDEATPAAVGELANGEYALIRVDDDGPGIDAERRAKIFEPFFTSKSLGSGIGLAIVQSVVSEHGGAIQLETEPGEGTSFRVYLPLAEDTTSKPETRPAPASEEVGSDESLTVMLIDDEPQLLDVVALMLEALGHECIVCQDHHGAFDLIDRHADQLDLVITDYAMPDLTGLDVLDHCRLRAPDVAVLLTTGYAERDARRLAEEKGAFDILMKPMDMKGLSDALGKVSSSLSRVD